MKETKTEKNIVELVERNVDGDGQWEVTAIMINTNALLALVIVRNGDTETHFVMHGTNVLPKHQATGNVFTATMKMYAMPLIVSVNMHDVVRVRAILHIIDSHVIRALNIKDEDH